MAPESDFSAASELFDFPISKALGVDVVPQSREAAAMAELFDLRERFYLPKSWYHGMAIAQ